MKNIIEIPKNVCKECGKREATQLCDFVKGVWNWVGHPPKENGKFPQDLTMSGTYTCDLMLCKECSTQVENNDYCKKHANVLKDRFSKIKNI